jgi:hypothetical protein
MIGYVTVGVFNRAYCRDLEGDTLAAFCIGPAS